MFENSKGAWIALVALGIIGWYGTGSNGRTDGHSPDNAAQVKSAGAWFVDQLEADITRNPARRVRALNECAGGSLGRDGKIDWIAARRCYERLVVQS